MRTFLFTAFAAFALLPSAYAQDRQPAPSPQALTDVYACAQVQDDAGRLQCYDGAVGRLRQAESQGQVVAVDRQQARDLERESFGFHLPSLSRLLPNLDGGDQQIDHVQMTVSRISVSPFGYSTFVMDDGQVWEQVEPENARNVRVGDTVTIESASFGSFRLISPRGGAGHRVRRAS
jgi:hypothetical protein